MVALLSLLGQRSEAQQRIKMAKDVGGFARKRSAHGCRGREFAADDPCQNLFPIVWRGGPAGVLGPCPLHRRVPVAFVTPAEGLLVSCDPAVIRVYARLGNQRNRGL